MVAKQFNSWYPHMFTDVLKSGGSTYSYEGRKISGYAVGGFSKVQHHVEILDIAQGDLLFFTNMVRKVVEEYEHLLSQQNYYIGTHYLEEIGVLFIDIVKVYQDKDEAISVGNENQQVSIYSIDKDEYYILDDAVEDYKDDVGC